MVTPQIVGARHYRIAQEIRKTLAGYEELKDIIAMLGIEELSREDRATSIGPGASSAFSPSRFRHGAIHRSGRAAWFHSKTRSTDASGYSTTNSLTGPNMRFT